MRNYLYDMFYDLHSLVTYVLCTAIQNISHSFPGKECVEY